MRKGAGLWQTTKALMEFMTIKDAEEGLKKTQTVILPVGCVSSMDGIALEHRYA